MLGLKLNHVSKRGHRRVVPAMAAMVTRNIWVIEINLSQSVVTTYVDLYIKNKGYWKYLFIPKF